MPSTSAKQHRFMQAVAHSPSFAKKAGVSQSVGKDFSAADKGRTFSKGGMMKKGKRFNGDDGESEVEYDSDKTYSGRFTDDETGGLAENTPTRAAPVPSRAAPVAKAAPKVDFSDVKSGSSASTPPKVDFSDVKSGSSASTPLTVFSQEAKAEREKKLQAELADLDRDAGKSSEAKKPAPLSNAEKLAVGSAIVGTSAVAAGLTAAGVAKLAGKKASIIEKVIEKFTSKKSKTPPADALAKIKVPSEAEKLAELASSAAKEKAAGAATPSRSTAQTDRIQTPTRNLPNTLAERARTIAERAPTGGGRIQTPTRNLSSTLAERARTIAERAPTGGGRIQTPRRTLTDTLAERTAVAAERSKARGGRIVRMASGGSVSAASSRADGIAQRGKTKFRIY